MSEAPDAWDLMIEKCLALQVAVDEAMSSVGTDPYAQMRIEELRREWAQLTQEALSQPLTPTRPGPGAGESSAANE